MSRFVTFKDTAQLTEEGTMGLRVERSFNVDNIEAVDVWNDETVVVTVVSGKTYGVYGNSKEITDAITGKKEVPANFRVDREEK